MRNIFAIARLTISEALRTRIVVVVLLILALLLLRLPNVEGAGTIESQLQNFVSYALNAVSLLLGFSAVFLACATLTGDIRNRTIHMVLTKPVSRFQVLLGKWVGINLLMLVLLVVCSITVYGFARVIKARNYEFERDRIAVRDTFWVARVAANPVPPDDLAERAQEWLESQAKQGHAFARGETFALQQRIKQLEEDWRTIPPSVARIYVFENLIPPRDSQAAIQVRYHARGTQLSMDELVPIMFAFADPETGQQISPWHEAREKSMFSHQFLARGQAVIRDGKAAIIVANPEVSSERLTIHLEEDDWLQILYQVGTFEENYVKTILIILGRLAFLSGLGLLFGTFASFPVAALGAFTAYVLCLATPFLLESIGSNMEYWSADADPYGRFGPIIRIPLEIVLKVLLPNFGAYDGVRFLLNGLYIPYDLLARALGHTLIYGAALLVLPGWLVFRSREIAGVTV